MRYTVLLAALLLPTLVFAESSQVTVTQDATVAGESAPFEAVVSTEQKELILSTTKKDGAVPVTFTVYVSPKPKPAVASSSQAAAAVESSESIQGSISGLSPQAGEVVAPFFVLVDGGRQAAADVLDTQIASTKAALGPDAGEVLSAEETKNAATNPMGAFWFILQTIWLYILTILRWLVGNAGIFYPAFALLFFYILWRTIRRFRRPSY